MLPRFFCIRVTAGALLLVASCGCVGQPEQGQPILSVRYHFGDDADGKLGWASPDFDDTGWTTGPNGKWPLPPFSSDGFMWVRVRVPLATSAVEPLAIRSRGSLGTFGLEIPAADEIFVNGHLAGVQGRLPPKSVPVLYTQTAVFDLPAGSAVAGTSALVAYRLWYPPFALKGLKPLFGDTHFEIADRNYLHLAQRAEAMTVLIADGPDLALNIIILILGAGLLLSYRWTGGREVLFCGAMLVSMTLYSLRLHLYYDGILNVSSWTNWLLTVALQALYTGFSLEFVLAVHGLNNAGLRRMYWAVWLMFNGSCFVVFESMSPSTTFVWFWWALLVSFLGWQLLQLSVNAWTLVASGKNRVIALSMIAISVTHSLDGLGLADVLTIGPVRATYGALAFFLCELSLLLMLSGRAWQAWRARDELRVELDAAREVQLQLVPTPVQVPGLRIESVYEPAKRVGGDFYRILSDGDGGVTVVFGDVSGKGLRAAMTVAAIVGAMRTMAVRRPAEMLNALNQGLSGQLRDGFVTCCVTNLAKDGQATIANAGHLSPYLAGSELTVETGLPLGIHKDASYPETHFTLPASQVLTFVSDGIVEARNPSGELFGFERTLEISISSAETIAQAAKEFGQEDDITVLTITRVPIP